jgi:hypothetical protein
MEMSKPTWMRWVLLAAAVYNVAWGAAVVLAPNAAFHLAGVEPPLYPQIWQCVGMIVGVYGVGYAIAAFDPLRHWPIVLVGLLGKVLGPIGFVWSIGSGAFPLAFAWTILTNDLIWWIPFGLILWHALSASMERGSDVAAPSLDEAMRSFQDQSGSTLGRLSGERPLLVVFLRHLGCTFCREALGDLRSRRSAIESEGVGVAVVHMADDKQALALLRGYGLEDLPRFSDPDRRLYRAFGLKRGSFWQLFGPKLWIRGLGTTLRGHRVGKLVGDGFQMPGVFLVDDGRIVRSFVHGSAGDRPDYGALACPA